MLCPGGRFVLDPRDRLGNPVENWDWHHTVIFGALLPVSVVAIVADLLAGASEKRLKKVFSMMVPGFGIGVLLQLIASLI